MDTETFLLAREEILQRMRARRLSLGDAKPSRWSWISESLMGTLKVMSRLGGPAAFDGLLPKILFPLAAPLVGMVFGFVKEKGLPFLGNKKPAWTRFVPFL